MKELMFLWAILSLAACVLLYSAATVAHHAKPEPHYTASFCEATEGDWDHGVCTYGNNVACTMRMCFLSDEYFAQKEI
jgi:invasion protein IalB